MAEIWQAPEDIKQQVNELKAEHHPHLAAASLWVLCSDGKAVKDNQIIPTQSKKCTKTEKLSSGHDFKIIIMAEVWDKLTDKQRQIALDEALCRCGVQRVPQTVEVNGKKEELKDEFGRTIFTEELAYDKLGQPKWKINPPDAGLYFALLARHGQYSEAAENVHRAIEHQPLKRPMAAERADAAEAELDAEMAF